MTTPFDGLEAACFNSVLATMGKPAVWTPNGSVIPKTGNVLFNNPTDSRKMAELDFDPDQNRMEYYIGTFDGLKESVDAGLVKEYVTIGTDVWYISKVTKLYDGWTFIATLDIAE
jgi:hypothetical protein